MIRDIYIKSPTDPNYKVNILEHSDEIESIISKIRMILGTKPGTILGDLNFGIAIEDLVFQTKINKIDLENKIKSQVSQYIRESSEYDIKTEVNFGNADGYDYAVIDIFINSQKVSGILIK